MVFSPGVLSTSRPCRTGRRDWRRRHLRHAELRVGRYWSGHHRLSSHQRWGGEDMKHMFHQKRLPAASVGHPNATVEGPCFAVEGGGVLILVLSWAQDGLG